MGANGIGLGWQPGQALGTSSFPYHSPQLKTQMWQLLKGHDHLQDEFSVFFDHLRPAASRMGDFEEINWTEEKEYEVLALRLQWAWGGGRSRVGVVPAQGLC